MYQGLRLNLGKSNKVIIFESILTNFNVSKNSRGGSIITMNGSNLKPNDHCQVKHGKIPDTHGIKYVECSKRQSTKKVSVAGKKTVSELIYSKAILAHLLL